MELWRMVTSCGGGVVDVMVSKFTGSWSIYLEVSGPVEISWRSGHRLEEFFCGLPIIGTGGVKGQMMRRQKISIHQLFYSGTRM